MSFGVRLPALLLVITLASCSKMTISNEESAAPAAVYPHSSTWSSSHMEGVARYPNSCKSCHRDSSLIAGKTVPLLNNLSCQPACHGPRATNWVQINKTPVNTDCQGSCHAHDSKYNANFEHYPAALGLCRSCHTATAAHLVSGGADQVTTERTSASCFSCHKRNDDQSGSVHPALAMAQGSTRDCTNCHDPHGVSANQPLLKNVYGGDTVEENPLCFGCHAATLVTTQVVTNETRFRDGSNNLHYVHSNQNTYCVDCHALHSSQRPRLIHSSFSNFGALGFKTTSTGGTCVVYCHNDTYLRTYVNTP